MKDILKRLLLKHFQKRSLPSFPHLCIVYLYSKIVLTVLCSVLSATNSSQGRNYFYLQRFRNSEYTYLSIKEIFIIEQDQVLAYVASAIEVDRLEL